jgi:CRP-like cAMP-binding protein
MAVFMAPPALPISRGHMHPSAVQRFHQQVAQTAACNGAHTVDQRCARWLLLARHRIGSDDLPLTQEFLSMMLAVRRAGVTMAAGGHVRKPDK